jgi:hypothetical protein
MSNILLLILGIFRPKLGLYSVPRCPPYGLGVLHSPTSPPQVHRDNSVWSTSPEPPLLLAVTSMHWQHSTLKPPHQTVPIGLVQEARATLRARRRMPPSLLRRRSRLPPTILHVNVWSRPSAANSLRRRITSQILSASSWILGAVSLERQAAIVTTLPATVPLVPMAAFRSAIPVSISLTVTSLYG